MFIKIVQGKMVRKYSTVMDTKRKMRYKSVNPIKEKYYQCPILTKQIYFHANQKFKKTIGEFYDLHKTDKLAIIGRLNFEIIPT